ncbi:MAG: hypothetical protein AAGM22_28835 [Acidobacteriota bacterium]
MKTLLLTITAVALATLPFADLSADDADVTLTVEKGEALDVLFLTTKPDTQEKLGDYFATVSPIVKKAGYTPKPGFALSATRGNYDPSRVVFASWRSPEDRAEAMAAIDANVENFHERRREIWSSFNMTVYTMENDVAVAMDADKTYVMTAYWRTDGDGFDAFTKSWRKSAGRAGGTVVLELEDGWSPFGYRYDPDYLAITEWKSDKAFETFHAGLGIDTAAVSHVDEWVLDVKAKN